MIKGQKNEYRSPAVMVIWDDPTANIKIESEILGWTQHEVMNLHASNQPTKPNQIFLVNLEKCEEVLAQRKLRSVSLQILSKMMVPLEAVKKAHSIQVLIDEPLSDYAPSFERSSGLRVSDISPATSFASLSVEYFANLRKAA